ncbi:MAG: hypothetical protein KIS92_19460 [Planctomycetota bacterium]|nr:hypothetical protein [Planctomycetota bacterium]
MTFLTYFDVNFAARGLTMIESLLRHHAGADVTVLCLDAKTAEILGEMLGPRASLVTLEALEAGEPALAAARSTRSLWEYYATQTPFLIRRTLERLDPGALAVYVDADCYFFSDLEDVLAEFEGRSIGLSAHRFNRESEALKAYGTYNAGFGLFRNDAQGRACARDWCEKCLAACSEKGTGDAFMNQGYLNAWPARFPGAKVLAHAGQNLGPWNVGSHALESRRGGMFVDGFPLVLFHFSGLVQSREGTWQTTYPFESLRNPLVLKKIYRPYCKALDATRRKLQKRFGIAGTESVRPLKPGTPVLDLDRGKLKVVSGKPTRARRPWLNWI